MEKQFLTYIQNAQRILITSHISPDPDAVSSLLLLGTTLRINYPEKQVEIILEEEPMGLNFLEGYKQIRFTPLLKAIEKYQPDLFIGLDGNNYDRFSRHDGTSVRKLIQSSDIKSVVIDHHEPEGMDQFSVYINHGYPATVHDIYEVCFNRLHLKKPEGFAQTTMLGLYADTGGFVYMKDGHHSEVFTLANELITSGADIEQIRNLLSQYSSADMKVLSELTANVSHDQGYSYSFIRDKFIKNWLSSGRNQSELQRAIGQFLDEYIRNIDGRLWGFIVYRNTLQGDNMYSVSFRSLGGAKDVSKIANKLGGGGHKPAAAAKFQAKDVEKAIELVKSAIKS